MAQIIGYCCINMSLNESKPKVTTNRSMTKKTFLQRGITYASELALMNSKDLLPILQWNLKNKIKLFRMSSDMFPWASEYSLKDMPEYRQIKYYLKQAGEFSLANDIRITTHPGPFNVLGSPNELAVLNTISDLELHGEVFDLMGLHRSPYNKINIHCNGTYGDKQATMDRFCDNFTNRLSDAVKSRLTVENDDKASMYSVKDLMYIHNKIGIPIVFDYHHHKFCTGDLSEQEALTLAASTWPSDIIPVVHYSESKALHESNQKIKPQAHSDFINALPNTYGIKIAIQVEAKAKERAILKFIY